MQAFETRSNFNQHIKTCENNDTCKIIMPKPGSNKLYFKNHYMSSKLPCFIAFDFETVNIPFVNLFPKQVKSSQQRETHQQALSYRWTLISVYPTIRNKNGKMVKWQPNETKSFRGTNHKEVIDEFVKDILELNKKLFYKLRPGFEWNKETKQFEYFSNMIPLTEKQLKEHNEAKNCPWCNCLYNDKNDKVKIAKRKGMFKDDNGNKLAVCQWCFPKIDDRHNCHKHGSEECSHTNAVLYKDLDEEDKDLIDEQEHCGLCGNKDKLFGQEYKDEKVFKKVKHHNHFTGEYITHLCNACNIKEGKKTKFIPIYAHNLSGYDSHLFIKELACEMSEKTKMKLLPKTTEEYISFDFGCLRFLDSLRQFGMSLDEVAKSLVDENFKHTRDYINKMFSDLSKDKREKLFQLFRQKGVFPYDYANSYERMNETQLPSKDKFYSKLKQDGISWRDYYRAKLVWRLTGCETLGDYCDIYMDIDVMLLADCLENYRDTIYNKNEIDPFHSYSAPGLSWQVGLKQCGEAFEKAHPGEKFSLDLLTDYNMLLMFESGIRGGVSGVLCRRHAIANNKYLQNYDPNKPSQYLLYLDANNLYGYVMKQKESRI